MSLDGFSSQMTAKTVTFLPRQRSKRFSNIPGFPRFPSTSGFRVFSMDTLNYARTSSWLNQARVRKMFLTRTHTEAITPFKWSERSVAEVGMSENNQRPAEPFLALSVVRSWFPLRSRQNSFVFNDMPEFYSGTQPLRFRRINTRYQDNVSRVGLGSFCHFLSWARFLARSSSIRPTALQSSFFLSSFRCVRTDRNSRVQSMGVVRASRRRLHRSVSVTTLTHWLALRTLGPFGDRFGRNSSFDCSAKLNKNPLPDGSLDGLYRCVSMSQANLPPGVRRRP